MIEKNVEWDQFSSDIHKQMRDDRENGIAYLISGSLALGGGLTGAGVSDDQIEKGAYSVFQTIGIASAGYGLYTWKIGGSERELYSILRNISSLSDFERTQLLRTYYRFRESRKEKERIIKIVIHSLIAGLNIYNATQQKESSMKNALYFVGGINAIAAI